MDSLRERLYDIIFEADTPAGKSFDLVLIFVIILSVVAVVLESIPGIAAQPLLVQQPGEAEGISPPDA